MQEDAIGRPDPQEPARAPAARRPRHWLRLGMIVLVSLFVGGIASRAIGERGYGPPFFAAGWDPVRVEDGADRVTRHVGIEIDASNEQVDKLRAIVKNAVRDLLPMREKSLTLRQRAQSLLDGPAVDRAAIEQFRAEQMALADAASKRIAQAIGDAAEVLTPEQRRRLHDRIAEWREQRLFWHGWHRG
jgi:protein CpxP